MATASKENRPSTQNPVQLSLDDGSASFLGYANGTACESKAEQTNALIATIRIPDTVGTEKGPLDSLYPSIISATLVIAGWFVVNKAQANRERRKQIRDGISQTQKLVDELEDLSINYHTQSRDLAQERKLISLLGRVEKLCTNLPSYTRDQKAFPAINSQKLNIAAKTLQTCRKAMTLHHFADEHDAKIEPNDPIVQEIANSLNDLRDELETIRTSALD